MRARDIVSVGNRDHYPPEVWGWLDHLRARDELSGSTRTIDPVPERPPLPGLHGFSLFPPKPTRHGRRDVDELLVKLGLRRR